MYLEIDNRMCSEGCFPTADSAAEYLGALSAREILRFPYPIIQARGELENLKNTKLTSKTKEALMCDHCFVFSLQVKIHMIHLSTYLNGPS